MSGQHDLTKALANLWSETPNDDKTVAICTKKKQQPVMTYEPCI